MNAKLLRRWKDETAPALLEHWSETFVLQKNEVWARRRWKDDEGGENTQFYSFRIDSLDSLSFISGLTGLVTEAKTVFVNDGRLWYGEWWTKLATGDTPWFETEPEARLAAFEDAVAARVKEVGHG